jgi:hypothetical protein
MVVGTKPKRAEDQDQDGSAVRPALSVILPSCSTPAVQRTTLGHLGNQTIASDIEVIVVCPQPERHEEVADLVVPFHSVRFIASPADCCSLGRQRAIGTLAAKAEFIAFGEDHCAPAPDWAESLVAAFRSGPWAGIGVAMHNANPQTALSWGNLVIGYYNWVAPVHAGEIENISGSNATFRRSLLTPFGDDLAELLERGGAVQAELRKRGHRFFIEPAARVYHKNFSLLSSTLRLRYDIGRFNGARQVRGKGIVGRLVAAVLAPVEVGLRLGKIVKRMAARGYPVRPRLVFGLGVGLSGDVVGIMTGALLGMGNAERRVYEGEFNRDQHMRPSERGLTLIEPAPAPPVEPCTTKAAPIPASTPPAAA